MTGQGPCARMPRHAGSCSESGESHQDQQHLEPQPFWSMSLPGMTKLEPRFPGARSPREVPTLGPGSSHTSGPSGHHSMTPELRLEPGHEHGARAPGLPSVRTQPERGQLEKGGAGSGVSTTSPLPHSTPALAGAPDHPPLPHKPASSLTGGPITEAPPQGHLP